VLTNRRSVPLTFSFDLNIEGSGSLSPHRKPSASQKGLRSRFPSREELSVPVRPVTGWFNQEALNRSFDFSFKLFIGYPQPKTRFLS